MHHASILSAFDSSIGFHAGNIASWKKKEGEEVAAGDSIAEIETDKVSSLPLVYDIPIFEACLKA